MLLVIQVFFGIPVENRINEVVISSEKIIIENKIFLNSAIFFSVIFDLNAVLFISK